MHPVENIRLSQQARDRLIQLKRKTGIKNWNVLCRWAFCVSLADPSPPSDRHLNADSNVEMTWKVFGGKDEEIFTALLLQRCKDDKIDLNTDDVVRQFRLHLDRGIGYLAADSQVKTITGLLMKVTSNRL